VVSTVVEASMAAVVSVEEVVSAAVAPLTMELGVEAIAADLAVTAEDGVAIVVATVDAATAVGVEALGDTRGGAGVLASDSRPIGVGVMDTLITMDIRPIIPTIPMTGMKATTIPMTRPTLRKTMGMRVRLSAAVLHGRTDTRSRVRAAALARPLLTRLTSHQPETARRTSATHADPRPRGPQCRMLFVRCNACHPMRDIGR
jgi:hypothetical protein